MVATEADVGSRAWSIDCDQKRGKRVLGKQERREKTSITCQVFQAHTASREDQELSPSFTDGRQPTAYCDMIL